MALYRMYKNGIYGRRYKKHYIVKIDGFYCVYLDKDKPATNEKFENIKEAEWWITKEVATEEDMELIQELYSQELHLLNELMFAYMEAEKEKGLSEKRKKEYDLLTTVRGRKAKNKPM